MTIFELRKIAAEMSIPFNEAAFARFRHVREHMFIELEEMDVEYPDLMNELVAGTLAIRRFIELAREQRALFRAVTVKPSADRITDEMVQAARAYPVDKLIDFKRGTFTAWCHEDKRPSLYYAKRINKAVCPVCNKYFDSIAVVMATQGLNFIEAVRQLAA